MTLFGLTVTAQPAGAPVAVRPTMPTKPLSGVMVIFEVAEDPDRKLTEFGLAVMVRSVTTTDTVTD